VYIYRMKAIAYYRVSSQQQGRSGLGLDAQRKIANDYASAHNYQLINELTDIESGKKDNRPALQQALAECKKHKAMLIIAKLDRLSRDLHFITGIMKAKIEFVCCDNPHANKMTLQIMGVMAEYEREQISARTKAALQAAKIRGIKLGTNGKKLAAENQKKAKKDAIDLAPRIKDLRDQGITSIRKIAAHLGKHPTQVVRILNRIA